MYFFTSRSRVSAKSSTSSVEADEYCRRLESPGLRLLEATGEVLLCPELEEISNSAQLSLMGNETNGVRELLTYVVLKKQNTHRRSVIGGWLSCNLMFHGCTERSGESGQLLQRPPRGRPGNARGATAPGRAKNVLSVYR